MYADYFRIAPASLYNQNRLYGRPLQNFVNNTYELKEFLGGLYEIVLTDAMDVIYNRTSMAYLFHEIIRPQIESQHFEFSFNQNILLQKTLILPAILNVQPLLLDFAKERSNSVYIVSQEILQNVLTIPVSPLAPESPLDFNIQDVFILAKLIDHAINNVGDGRREIFYDIQDQIINNKASEAIEELKEEIDYTTDFEVDFVVPLLPGAWFRKVSKSMRDVWFCNLLYLESDLQDIYFSLTHQNPPLDVKLEEIRCHILKWENLFSGRYEHGIRVTGGIQSIFEPYFS